MGDPITYETLRNRQKQEERPGLSRLDPGFYRKARARIETLRQEYERAHDQDPTGQRTMVLQDEVAKMEETLRELYRLRERKVVLAAVAAARGGHPDVDNLTPVEEELFGTLVQKLRQHRERTLEEGGFEEVDAAAPAGAADDREGEAAPRTKAAPGAKAETAPGAPARDGADGGTDGAGDGPATDGEEAPPPVERVLVRVLEDLDPFVATDMHTYALAADDVVHLPKEQADVLCKRGKAVELPGTVE